MNLKEVITILSLITIGSILIGIWFMTGIMIFNTIGLVFLGVGLGWYFGLRALKS